jgi:hypothetical protein
LMIQELAARVSRVRTGTARGTRSRRQAAMHPKHSGVPARVRGRSWPVSGLPVRPRGVDEPTAAGVTQDRLTWCDCDDLVWFGAP